LPQQQLGLLFLGLWLLTWGVPTTHQIQALHRRQYHRLQLALLRFALYQAASIPLLLAALSLRGCFEGGLYWLALGMILSLMVALFNAWVLLVEIVR
jgi:modulator of FtsH protease